MNKTKLSKMLGVASVGASLAFMPVQSAFAEDDLEEVIVTGSFIRGTPEDAALPVDVLNRDDLEDVGNPSIVEMIRNLGMTSGNLGETNQFDARGGQGNEGVATVNLRGLGGARTLVLLNGKRHVATEGNGVDISVMPSTAIGRVEILKDGAAALYGSDAIGGVVNFITRENFEGLEIRGSHQDIQDSDGDQNIAMIFGHQFDNWHVAFSAEYEERGQLAIKDRDWALPTFAENPQAGFSSIGNPGMVFAALNNAPIVGFGGARPDANCDLLGGTVSGPFCRFQFTFFDNLIEETETQKYFAEANWDISDNLRFHFEALYAEVDIPEWDTSPSYPPQSLLGPDRFVPATHPGLIDYKAQNPGFFQDVDLTAAGIGVVPPEAQGAIVWSRMLGVAGRNGEPESAQRLTETKRWSMGLDGETDNGIGFDVSLSWSERVRTLGGSDMFIERMAFALDGLGGPNCDRNTAFRNGTFGQNGCEYYNPFSNAIQVSAVTGVVNPQFNPAVANSDELINWLTADTGSKTTSKLTVFDAVFNALTDIELAGGNVGWAAGMQIRLTDYEFRLKDVADRAINPCPFSDPLSVSLGHTTSLDCGAGGAGQLAFLAATDEEVTDNDIYAVFAELALPLADNFDVQIAARYEDYGDDNGGDTFDPKVAFSWTPTDTVTLRGSASSTFRGPPASFLGGVGTALEFVGSPVLAFKARDTAGNPNLEPETAIAVNLGAIYQNDAIYASLDYWSFDFEDPFQTESGGQILGAYLSNDCADGGTGVGTAACDILRGRITPTGAPAAQLQRIGTNLINGSDVQTSGLDFVFSYTFDDVMNGVLTVGTEGTYTLEYESDDFITLEGLTLAPGGDFVGKLNEGTPFLPLPDLKANFFVKWGNDQHRVTYNALHTAEYEDDAPGLPSLGTIDDHLTHDIHYINNMFENWTLSLSVVNATDEEPPTASTDLAYDGYTHNAFGRMIKLGVVFTPQL
jgi:outer membrane receptor protein involved in Fe transport